MQVDFPDHKALSDYMQQKEKGSLLVSYSNCIDYKGMVLGIMVFFDVPKGKYELDLQWISFGLDLYGDTLLECYLYEFEQLETLLDYLFSKYKIAVTDIPQDYHIDSSKFPDPIKNQTEKALFEAAWQQFQVDFKNGNFLEPSLRLVYSSQD